MDARLNVNREEVVASLGGEEAVQRMDHDARADALEEFLSGRLDAIVAAKKRGKEFPTVAELADKVDTRGYRRGTGKLFMHDRNIQQPDAGNAGQGRRRRAPDAGEADADSFLQPALSARRASLAERAARPQERAL